MTMDSTLCWWAVPIWVPAVIPFWPRWQRTVWTATIPIFRCGAWTPTSPPTTPVPMPRPPPMSPVWRWSRPVRCSGKRSCGRVLPCWGFPRRKPSLTASGSGQRTDGRSASRRSAMPALRDTTAACRRAESHSSPVSPPPFMVGAAEIDLDPETGEVQVVDYAAAVDCGTVINPALGPGADRGRYCTGHRHGAL